jgi:photosystem II stability/assembly factor-like uncharacterized protein
MRGMAISPDYASDGTVFAGAYGGGVYRSQDHGDTWTAMDTGLTWMYAGALDISPNYGQDQTVFCGMYEQVLKSTNAGSAWYELDPDPANWFYSRALGVSPDYAADQTLFSGSTSQGPYSLYRSTDGGATFVPLDPGYGTARCIAFSPDYGADQTVFTGSDGVYRSVNGGDSWTRVFKTSTVYGLAVSPDFSTDGVLFAATNGEGVFRSLDRGDTWKAVNNGLDDLNLRTVAVSKDFTLDRTVFASTKSHGLYISTDGAVTWTAVGPEGVFIRTIAVSPDYANDRTIYLGAFDGVYRTQDAGGRWDRVLTFSRYDDRNEFTFFSEEDWTRYYDSFATAKGLSHSNITGAWAAIYFAGDGVTWIGMRAPMAGIANVYVDDVLEAQVDCYASSARWREVMFTKTGLGPGTHKLVIEVSGNKNPSSNGRTIMVDAFEIAE